MDSASSDRANRATPGLTDWGKPEITKLSLKSARARLGTIGRERWRVLTVCAVMVAAVVLGLTFTLVAELRSAFLSQISFNGQGANFKSETRADSPAARIKGDICTRTIHDKPSGQMIDVVMPCSEAKSGGAPIPPAGTRWNR